MAGLLKALEKINTNEDVKLDVELPSDQFDDEYCTSCSDDNIAITLKTETLHSQHRAPLCFKCFDSLYLKAKKIALGG